VKTVLPSNQVSFSLRANTTSINSLSSTGLASDSLPGLKKKARFLLMIDLATKLRVVSVIKTYPELVMQSESAEEVIESFTTSWLAHFPKPQTVIADNAKSLS